MKKVKKWQIALFGSLIGLINGFFGAGGGMIVVPILNKYFGFNQKKAQATALFVILPLSIISCIVYFCYKSVNFSTTYPIMIGIVLGGAIGAYVLNKLKNNIIKCIFIFFMLAGGIMMLVW